MATAISRQGGNVVVTVTLAGAGILDATDGVDANGDPVAASVDRKKQIALEWAAHECEVSARQMLVSDEQIDAEAAEVKANADSRAAARKAARPTGGL